MDFVKFEKNQTFHFGSQAVRDVVHTARHYHNLFELYYLESGRCSYFIEDQLYELTPRDIVLIPAGMIHNAVYPDEPHTRMLINCSDDYIPEGISFDQMRFYRCSDSEREVYSLLKRIEREYIHRDAFSDVMLRCCTNALFVLIARTYVPGEGVKKTMVEEITRYLREHFRSDISLAGTARQFGVSPEHLSRCFKKQTGFGFNEYVNMMRLREAERLLASEPDKSILEIAFLCGFHDSNYFSMKFHKEYGAAPSKFRTEYKKTGSFQNEKSAETREYTGSCRF